MGVDSKESNEHRECKEERINLLETTKGLKKKFQIYNSNKERLMKYKEQ
jgi:hypothetical protein